MKTLLYILAGAVVVGGAIYGISKITSTSVTTDNTNISIIDQTSDINTSNQNSNSIASSKTSVTDFGKCDLSKFSSVTVVGAGGGLKDVTLAINDGKALETKTTGGKNLIIDRTTSVCAGWVDSFKISMNYNGLSASANPKGINTNGVWFSVTSNASQSETNLKEVNENGKAILVFETRSTISGKPGYISIDQKKADKAHGINISTTNIIYPSTDLMLSTPIEQIIEASAVTYQTSTLSYK